MGKKVLASDFLNFPTVLAIATVENDNVQLDSRATDRLLKPITDGPRFIEETFDVARRHPLNPTTANRRVAG